MNNIHICMASDSNYAPFMCSCIASILMNSNNDDCINMHIIDASISEKDKSKISTLKEIKNFEIKYYVPNIDQYKSWFEKMDNKAHFSYAMFARLSISNLIAEDKILYLDCDIIVNKSLNELFNTNISNCYSAVARRPKETMDSIEKDKLYLGLDKEDYYFNSGVLLINNKLWKENNIFDKFLDYINNGGKLLWGDQAILNIVLKDKIKLIDKKYNFTSCKSCIMDDIYDVKDIVILHYITDQKPWKEYCPNLLFIEKFWEYFCMTPYFK